MMEIEKESKRLKLNHKKDGNIDNNTDGKENIEQLVAEEFEKTFQNVIKETVNEKINDYIRQVDFGALIEEQFKKNFNTNYTDNLNTIDMLKENYEKYKDDIKEENENSYINKLSVQMNHPLMTFIDDKPNKKTKNIEEIEFKPSNIDIQLFSKFVEYQNKVKINEDIVKQMPINFSNYKLVSHVGEFLEREGKTQTFLCNKTGISKSTMTSIVYNNNSISLENAWKIAIVLKASIEELFTYEEEF